VLPKWEPERGRVRIKIRVFRIKISRVEMWGATVKFSGLAHMTSCYLTPLLFLGGVAVAASAGIGTPALTTTVSNAMYRTDKAGHPFDAHDGSTQQFEEGGPYFYHAMGCESRARASILGLTQSACSLSPCRALSPPLTCPANRTASFCPFG